MISQFERFGSGPMTADQIVQQLKQLKQKSYGHEEEKEVWMAEGVPITERAPTGPFPGRTLRSPPSAGSLQRTQAERDRARRFGFPPARLMVLTDGSDNAQKAMDAALHYRRRNDFVFFVTCVPLGTDKQTNLDLTNKAKHVMDDVKDLIKERELGRWETAILPSSNPQQAVIDYAYKNNVDLIFIGTRGIESSTGDFHPDSFSKYVLHNSHCSVMLIR